VKILFLERSLGRGGAQRQLVELALGLKRRGHRVTLALFYNEGPLIPEALKRGANLYFLEKESRWDVFGFFRRIQNLVRREKPDILCTFLPVPNLVALICKLSNPKPLLVWGVRASNMKLKNYDRLTRLTYQAEVLGSRLANIIISNSKAGKRAVVSNGIPSRKVVVIPNGIDTERFRFDPLGRQKLRQFWKVTDSEILVGIIGRLDPMKDHQTFLRAAAHTAATMRNVRFVCVGDEGPIPRQELVSLGQSLGLNDVVWSNGRDDMPAVFSACDVICSSSAYGEGFSNTLAEAMACSRRCIATDVGDAREIIGTTGYIVPPADEITLASGIMTLCQEVAQCGANKEEACEYIQKNFSIDVMVDRFEDQFRRLTSFRNYDPHSH